MRCRHIALLSTERGSSTSPPEPFSDVSSAGISAAGMVSSRCSDIDLAPYLCSYIVDQEYDYDGYQCDANQREFEVGEEHKTQQQEGPVLLHRQHSEEETKAKRRQDSTNNAQISQQPLWCGIDRRRNRTRT